MYTYTMELKDYSYNIFIDEDYFTNIIKKIRAQNPYYKIMIVTDQNVEALYLKSFIGDNERIYSYIIEVGENSKSLLEAEKLYETLAEKSFTRKDLIIALGGGVVGDLAGFVAATYLRGIDYIQVPTSLLAQVDSSVGGKVAVNIKQGKNLVGSFYQPKAVYIDISFLKTLNKREMQSGIGEIIKHAYLSNDGLLEILTQHSLDNIMTVMLSVVKKNIQIKSYYVSQDEKESYLRMHLNLGHTIGHGIEKALDYRVSHGACVAYGIYYMGLLSGNEIIIDSIEKLLKLYHFDLNQILDWDQILYYMKRDKKRVEEDIQIIWMDDIGQTRIIKKSFKDFEKEIRENIK